MKTWIAGIAIVLLTAGAWAELQTVSVGGELRIRGGYYNWDRAGDDTAFVQERTRLGVTADFTDEVSAVIEMDSYDIWGEDFRSNYVTGLDARAASGDDVEMYQAYIQADKMWGAPLRLRVGRQEMAFGSQWLVGVNDEANEFTGLSFDALRLTYATDMFSVDAFASKLAETFGDFGDDDVDFYGIYASCFAVENVQFDAYWLYLNDDTNTVGKDVDLHTVGLRAAGTLSAFDFDAEVARQFGGIDAALGDFDYDEWAANIEAGYTFECCWKPRVFLGFDYFGGDAEDLSFNRLFSNQTYSHLLPETNLSNVLIYRTGLSIMPAERLDLGLDVSYFQVDDQRTNGWFLGWWEDGGSDNLGIETFLHGAYRYTDDLIFSAGWAHLFGGSGLDEGNFIDGNGFWRYAADDDNNFDYLFLETKLAF